MRMRNYEKLGVKLNGSESLQEATEKIYPNVLIECDIHAKLGDSYHDLKINDKKAIYKDNGEYVATVGDKYGLLQPFESIAYMQQYLDTGKLELTHGGQLDNGRKMFLISKIYGAESEVVKGDIVQAYINSSTSFDGSSTHKMQLVIERLACLNGAVRSEISFGINFKHTSRIKQRILNATQQIENAIKEFQKTVENYRLLAHKKVTAQQIQTFVRNVFVSNDEPIHTKTQNVIDRVISLAYNGKGQEIANVAGTAWGAYNGVTEYLTHEYGRNDESRVEAQWFGRSAQLNQKALSLAMNM